VPHGEQRREREQHRSERDARAHADDVPIEGLACRSLLGLVHGAHAADPGPVIGSRRGRCALEERGLNRRIERKAIELQEQKGNVLGVEHALMRLQEISS
jgi:hypothetical protein